MPNPLIDPHTEPTKEDLEDWLGLSRYRRFEAIYNELVDNDLDPSMVWSDRERSWYHSFEKGKKELFGIKWGIDHFYALLVLSEDDYSKLIRHEKLSPESRVLLQRFGPRPPHRKARVEANLEKMRDQEAFLELVPLMVEILT
jgi:hypothetical protein